MCVSASNSTFKRKDARETTWRAEAWVKATKSRTRPKSQVYKSHVFFVLWKIALLLVSKNFQNESLQALSVMSRGRQQCINLAVGHLADREDCVFRACVL